MTAQERGQLTELTAKQAAGLKEVEYLKGSVDRLHKRMDEMHEYLKSMTNDISNILRQNDSHEEKLAQLQNITATLGESVVQVNRTCNRLKHVAVGFIALLIVMAILVGILGEEVLPKALSWLWALVGL